MNNHSIFDIGRLFRAFNYSMRGLITAFKYETAFRQEIILCIIFIPLAFYVGKSAAQIALLILSILLILIVELINSSIEAIVDRISKDPHELSGRAKDMSSAAVLIAIVNAILVWGVIFIFSFS
jgi:diacylglycerol kinase (ATP)